MERPFGCFQDSDGTNIYMRKNDLQVKAFVMDSYMNFIWYKNPSRHQKGLVFQRKKALTSSHPLNWIDTQNIKTFGHHCCSGFTEEHPAHVDFDHFP